MSDDQRCVRCKAGGVPLNADALCEACGEPDTVTLTTRTPLVGAYPWCSTPELCAGKGYCPRDPNCGD